MNYIKNNRKTILSVIFYSCVILAGFNAYYLASNGISTEEPLFFQFASLIGVLLTGFGCFYELYFGKQFRK